MDKIKLLVKKILCTKPKDTDVLCNLQCILKEIKHIENPNCNLKKLSKKTDGFTKINGQTLPAEPSPPVNSVVLLETCNSKGESIKIIKSTRKVGTRSGIHIHKYGGYTLILSGEMTFFAQGKPINKYNNSGYFMPPCTPMSAANLGDKDVEQIDIFIGKPGEPFIEILEPNWPFTKVEKFSECSKH